MKKITARAWLYTAIGAGLAWSIIHLVILLTSSLPRGLFVADLAIATLSWAAAVSIVADVVLTHLHEMTRTSNLAKSISFIALGAAAGCTGGWAVTSIYNWIVTGVYPVYGYFAVVAAATSAAVALRHMFDEGDELFNSLDELGETR